MLNFVPILVPCHYEAQSLNYQYQQSIRPDQVVASSYNSVVDCCMK